MSIPTTETKQRLSELRETLSRWPGSTGRLWVLEVYSPESGELTERWNIRTGKPLRTGRKRGKANERN